MKKKIIGIVAGFNPKAADMIKTLLLDRIGDGSIDVLLSQELFRINPDPSKRLRDRQRFVLEETRALIDGGAEFVLVPDFASEPFIKSVQRQFAVAVLDINTAMSAVMNAGTSVTGILDKDLAGDWADEGGEGVGRRLFLSSQDQALLDATRERMRVVGVCEETLVVLKAMCEKLTAAGAETIMPNCSHYANAQPALVAAGFPVLDVYEAYAKVAIDALSQNERTAPR